MRFLEFKKLSEETMGDLIAKSDWLKNLFRPSDKPSSTTTSSPGLPLDTVQVTDLMGSKRQGYTHQGVDLRADIGTPVKATIDGRVLFAGNSGSVGGYGVKISSGKGREDSFFHLSKISVKKGDIVKVGQVIASSGASGDVTGPHLHWEVTVNGRFVNPLEGQNWAWAPGYGPDTIAGRRKK